MIDDTTARIGREKDHIMFDSRLAWNFVPDSFKIFVITVIDEAARRVYNDATRSNSESYESKEACKEALIHRQQMETVRYKDIYGIDYYDMSNYNLVIESTSAAPGEIAERILELEADFEKEIFKKIMVLNPSSVDTTKNPSEDGEIVVAYVKEKWILVSGKKKFMENTSKGEKFVTVKVDSTKSTNEGFMNFTNMN